MSVAEQDLSTRELWEQQSVAIEKRQSGWPTSFDIQAAGRELMRRTDLSPVRCARARGEQERRRDALRRSGAIDRYPVGV